MRNEELSLRLEGLGFSATEATVYLCLLRNPGWNGSQIAKELQLPRTTVYSVLDVLESRSAAFKEQGETVRWKSETPMILLNRLDQKWKDNLEGLEESLKAWEGELPEEGFWNISGRVRILDRLRFFINQARQEVLLSTNWKVELFKTEIEAALARGVKFRLFSFCEQEIAGLELIFVQHPPLGMKGQLDDRIMAVFDQTTVLMASGRGDAYKGIWTSHKMLVWVAAEHIHLDMYLMRLRSKLGRDPIDDDIRLDSLLEKELQKSLLTSGKKESDKIPGA